MDPIPATHPDVDVSDVPPLADLIPLAEVARMLGMTLQSAHRWRLHPTTPLAAWRRGHPWVSTVKAAEDFIRRRTLASTFAADSADSAMATRNALILGWAELPGGQEEGLLVQEALKLLKAPGHEDRFSTLRNALAELSRNSDLPNPRSIGMYLSKQEGKVVDGKMLRSNLNHKTGKVWRVVRVEDGKVPGLRDYSELVGTRFSLVPE